MAHGLDIAFPALASIIIVSSHTSATTWVINVSITQCYNVYNRYMHEHFVSYIYIGYIRIDGSIFKSNTRDPRSVYVSPRSRCQPWSSLLDCVSNNTYYGYYYGQSCSNEIGVLCCPNGNHEYTDKINNCYNL